MDGAMGLPEHHLIQGYAQVQGRVAAQMLVRQEEHTLALFEGSLKSSLGV
tara:strand:- start:492 stop:641 length:150 start_codon:yes stop_codon:yes gene_type:complete